KSGQLCGLYKNSLLEFSFFSGISDDNMRAAVIRNMKPKILRCGDPERQLVVFACAFADEYFSIINLDHAEASRLCRRGGRSRRLIVSYRDLARNRQPRVPILDGV